MGFHTIPSVYTEGAHVYHNANQSIPNDTATTVAFNSESYDTDGIHNNDTNNSRLTCQTAGKYIIVFNGVFDANATGFRSFAIFGDILTVSITLASVSFEPLGDFLYGADYAPHTLSTIRQLAVGDYVEVKARQNSGGALNLRRLTRYSPEFMMQRTG